MTDLDLGVLVYLQARQHALLGALLAYRVLCAIGLEELVGIEGREPLG